MSFLKNGNKAAEPIKIGYMCLGNPKDRKSWSGTFYKMYEHLQFDGVEIKWIQVRRRFWGDILEYLYKLFCKILHKNSLPLFLKHIARSYYFLPNELYQFDLIYAPCCGPYLYKLNSRVPIIYMSDASPEGLYDYYLFNNFKFNRRQGNEMEKVALNKASKIVYASDWAKDIAVNFYKQSPLKVSVIEIGANMDENDLQNIIQMKRSIITDGMLHILFLGVDWKRKGGDIALDCCRLLNERGLKSIIHIIGLREEPEVCKDKPYVDFVGFLNKNFRDQYDKLMYYLALSDILLLPTIAECAGVVFNECAACGIPSFTYLTGGTGNYVVDGENGYKLPLGATSEEFADLIHSVITNGELENLKKSSYAFYQRRNNWNLWGGKMKELICQILEK